MKRNFESKGAIGVPTPFGILTIHVMASNTPFLLCLADMDRHGIKFDNLRIHLLPSSFTTWRHLLWQTTNNQKHITLLPLTATKSRQQNKKTLSCFFAFRPREASLSNNNRQQEPHYPLSTTLVDAPRLNATMKPEFTEPPDLEVKVRKEEDAGAGQLRPGVAWCIEADLDLGGGNAEAVRPRKCLVQTKQSIRTNELWMSSSSGSPNPIRAPSIIVQWQTPNLPPSPTGRHDGPLLRSLNQLPRPKAASQRFSR
ncbi:hypothetical protein CGRA01v4_06196 [Colletotrichum graminicola]|nr:hypothetical protein CGRA01v4_06196 [Colletotrichum graminicola]